MIITSAEAQRYTQSVQCPSWIWQLISTCCFYKGCRTSFEYNQKYRDIMHSDRSEIWYLTFEQVTDHGAGLGTYIRQVALAAQAVGRRIRIFQALKPDQQARRCSEGFVTIVDVPMINTPARDTLGHWMRMSLSMAEAVCDELKSVPAPAAVEMPDGFALGYFLLQRKLTGEPLLNGIPLIICAHTPIGVIEDWIGSNVYRLPDWWTFRAEKWCYLAADAVVTLSEVMERLLSSRGYLDGNVPVRRSTNPYLSVKDLLPTAAGFNKNPVVGMASRMVDWKGLRHILDVAAVAEAAGLPVVFELCGHTHPDFDRARSDYAPLFVSGRVRYLGVLDAAALEERRGTWSCQLHPSPIDNFPYTVVEALSRGLPCFITEGNGVAEILPEVLRERLVVDFAKPLQVLERVAQATSIRHDLEGLDLTPLGADAYFANRDALVANLTDVSPRQLFPFVDGHQARRDLRPVPTRSPDRATARLTVVIPYYNMGPWISPCIASVLASTVPVQIVLVNDGSTDISSVAKLNDFRNHPSIRILDIPNGGVARARNTGVDQAATEFVALLDADDTVEPDYYARAMTVLDQYDNVGFVGCWCNDFLDETGETVRHWVTYNAEPMPNMIVNNTNCQSLIYRTDLFRAHGRHDPVLRMYLDDWDGMLGLLEAGCFGVMLPDALFNYRQRENSIFSTGRAAWNTNYAYIAYKRRKMFAQNAVEAVLFLNANGPNRNYHVLGQATAQDAPLFAPTGVRLPMRYRLARSLAKKLMRYSAKGL